jgi:hypothetical protein
MTEIQQAQTGSCGRVIFAKHTKKRANIYSFIAVNTIYREEVIAVIRSDAMSRKI